MLAYIPWVQEALRSGLIHVSAGQIPYAMEPARGLEPLTPSLQEKLFPVLWLTIAPIHAQHKGFCYLIAWLEMAVWMAAMAE